MKEISGIGILAIDSDSQRCSKRMTELMKVPGFSHIQSCFASELEYTLNTNGRIDVGLLSISDLSLESTKTLIHKFQQAEPSAKLILTDATEDHNRLIRYLEAGAWDYVYSWDTPDQIINKVKSAVSDRLDLSPKLAGEIVNRLHDLSRMRPQGISLSDGYSELTPREREVLTLVGKRMTNREIAEELVLEIGTVKNHVHSILKKLEVDNRYEAAAYNPYHSTHGHTFRL